MNACRSRKTSLRARLSPLATAFLLPLAGLAAPPLPKTAWHALPPSVVREGWQAREGTAAAKRERDPAVVRLPVRFRGNRQDRAYWDLAATLDLSRQQGLRFLFHCENPQPISGFTFYLKSGEGWYAVEFEHPDPSAWTEVEIRKSDARIEGRPRGWRHIEALRIAAWRGDDADSKLRLARLGLLPAQPRVALLRNESVAHGAPSELNTVFSATQLTADHLRAQGIGHLVLSDLDLDRPLQNETNVLLLPYAPALPDPVQARLAAFLEGGGKLLSFYTLPERLQSAIGIRLGSHIRQRRPGHFAALRATGDTISGLPATVRQQSWNIVSAQPLAGRASVAAMWHDDEGRSAGEPALLVSPSGMHMTHILVSDNPQDKRALLLAMIGHFLPETWAETARTALRNAGAVGAWRTAQETRRTLAAAAEPGSQTYRDLSAAMDHLEDARARLQAGRYPASIEASGLARQAFVRALAGTKRPRKSEHRGVWRHSAFPLDGMDWDETLGILARNGFNAFFPNMLWAGLAYTESEVLPVSPLVGGTRDDPLTDAAAAARKHGVALHVWKVCWNMGGRAPDAFVARMEREGRLQVSFSGQTNRQWLCPSHPANRALEIESLLETVRRHPIAGIHLDYMRYPGRDHCFCPGCRLRFEKQLGRAVATWPADTRADPELARSWAEFRRDTLNSVVEELARRARALRPDIKLSAAVFTNWPADRNTIGQDWAVWCRNGWLDFVCPMNYTANTARFEQQLRRQREWAGSVPVWPGIGIGVWPETGDPVRLFEQIEATRRQQAGGFMLFQYREHEARAILPLCGLGITRP